MPIICSCYYFDDIIKFKNFDLDDVLIDKKPNEHILVYKISHKTLIASKTFHTRFDGFLCILHIYIYSREIVIDFKRSKNNFKISIFAELFTDF